MDDRQLRDELVTLFVAGNDTTANALTWLCHALEEHRPLGSLNRARRTAYRDSSTVRGATTRAPSETLPAARHGTAAEANGRPGSEAAE